MRLCVRFFPAAAIEQWIHDNKKSFWPKQQRKKAHTLEKKSIDAQKKEKNIPNLKHFCGRKKC